MGKAATLVMRWACALNGLRREYRKQLFSNEECSQRATGKVMSFTKLIKFFTGGVFVISLSSVTFAILEDFLPRPSLSLVASTLIDGLVMMLWSYIVYRFGVCKSQIRVDAQGRTLNTPNQDSGTASDLGKPDE